MNAPKLCIKQLNTWADCTGKIIEDVDRLKADAHVLCFEEVHNSPEGVPDHIWPKHPGKRSGPINTKLYAQLCAVLQEEFVGYYAPQLRGFVHDSEASDYPLLEYGNAMFVRKGIQHSYRDAFIYGYLSKLIDDPEGTPVGKTGQAIDIFDGYGLITVAHAHGAWYKSDKTTNFPWRKEQVNGIIRLIAPHHEHLDELAKHDAYNPRVVFLGDLNVVSASHTVKDISKSKVFGRVGGWHLNPRCGVWCTRTALYTGELKEAGHAFASHNLHARLRTDDTVHSDHVAMIVETGVEN